MGKKVDYLITLPNNLLWTYKNDIVLPYIIQKKYVLGKLIT